MKAMKSYSSGVLLAICLIIVLAAARVGGQSGGDSVEAHVAAAKAAAGQEHTAVFNKDGDNEAVLIELRNEPQ